MGKEEAGEMVREGGGMASSFPLFSFFISNRGSECCPHVFSFRFERGQQALPPCLFFSFRMGAASTAPVSFLFFSNGGSTCCPRVFSFHFEWTGGQCVGFTLPPFLSVSIGGSVYPHAAPFLSVLNGGSVYRTCRPLFLLVSTGDSVKLTCRPRFMFFTPQ